MAAIIGALTALLGLSGKGAWTVYRYWHVQHEAREAARAREAKRMLSAKNREIRLLQQRLADCEARQGAAS
ncbi:MAG: hypothetical protein ACRDJ9_34125 [Dehalococcoidia bacterium]